MEGILQNRKKLLLDILHEEKSSGYSGGIYHKIQIELTYNSNHIEGSSLTHEQTRYIFETNTIGVETESINVDDVIETANHFRLVSLIIDNAKSILTEEFIKKLDKEKQEIANQLNRRTEFTVLRTTYGMFDEKGNLKQQPKPKKKESLDDDGMIIIDIP